MMTFRKNIDIFQEPYNLYKQLSLIITAMRLVRQLKNELFELYRIVLYCIVELYCIVLYEDKGSSPLPCLCVS